MRKTPTALALCTLMASTQWSCQGNLLNKKVTEGVIEYALSFPDYDPNSLMAGMLPEKTTVSFERGRQVAELSAGMGVFHTTLVADNENQEGDYHLSVLSKKLVSHLHDRDMQLFTRENPVLTILYSNETDTIAGFPCKKAVALFQDIHQREIELWYTDGITMDNPNWFNPFSEIAGVLLRYEMVQYGMRMRLEATNVAAGPVDANKFQLKGGYEQVKPEVLHHELAEVLGTFSL